MKTLVLNFNGGKGSIHFHDPVKEELVKSLRGMMTEG